MGFKFQPIKKISFPIVDENDAPVKEYLLDVGSESFVKALLNKGAAVLTLAKNLAEDPDGYDKLAFALKEYIDFSLGAGEYDFLFNRFEKNIFAMIELSRAITVEGGNALSAKAKATEQLYV